MTIQNIVFGKLTRESPALEQKKVIQENKSRSSSPKCSREGSSSMLDRTPVIEKVSAPPDIEMKVETVQPAAPEQPVAPAQPPQEPVETVAAEPIPNVTKLTEVTAENPKAVLLPESSSNSKNEEEQPDQQKPQEKKEEENPAAGETPNITSV